MIHFGTCSWAEKTLVRSGEFYPPGTNTPEKRLRYYAGAFDVVEVDSSYYAIPADKTVRRWAEWTPAGFTFHVKAYSLLTGHGAELAAIPPEVRDMLPAESLRKDRVRVTEKETLRAVFEIFKGVFRPLREAGKMGVTVFQYSRQFLYSVRNLDYIVFCREQMADLPMGVEFRHGSWFTHGRRESVFSFLREHGLTYITVDEPQYGNQATAPFLPGATTDIAYFRFHGRNRDNWLKRGVETSQRYDYSYSDEELKEFVPSIIEVSGKAKESYMMFNNHGSPGVRNAARLRQLVKEKTEEVKMP